MTPRVVAGLLVGFSGIVLLVWPDSDAGQQRAAVASCSAIVALQIASHRLVDRLVVFEAHGSGSEDDVLGDDRAQMLAGGLMMIAAGTLRGEWADLSLHDADAVALVYLSTHWRHRWIRRLHLCATAPAGVVRVALCLHQPGDRGRARRARAGRAVHVAHGARRRAGVRRRGHRALAANAPRPRRRRRCRTRGALPGERRNRQDGEQDAERRVSSARRRGNLASTLVVR